MIAYKINNKTNFIILVFVLTVFIIGCGDDSPSKPIVSPGGSSNNGTAGSNTTADPPDTTTDPPIEPEEIPLEDKKFNELTENEKFVELVLGVNSKVVVVNTLNLGLRVREVPGLDAKIIGGVFNQAIGIIVSDRRIKDNLYWFEVEWDPGEKVKCDIDPCRGWSAAVDQDDTRLLDLVLD